MNAPRQVRATAKQEAVEQTIMDTVDAAKMTPNEALGSLTAILGNAIITASGQMKAGAGGLARLQAMVVAGLDQHIKSELRVRAGEAE